MTACTRRAEETASTVIIELLADVALLLWGLRMVRTGVARGFGARLRQLLGRSIRNRFGALLAGLGVTALLQSSTATALIASSFTARGFMGTATALAIMLGADIGTTLVAQALSLPIGWVGSLALLGGVVLFSTGKVTIWRDVGRIAVGLGLMLLALRLIVSTSSVLRESVALHEILGLVANDMLLAIVFAAALTWLAHSSLATVLLVMSLAAAGVVDPRGALLLVLGANLGGALPAVIASFNEGPEARRVTFGNAAFKAAGTLLALPLLPLAEAWLITLDSDPARLVVNFHTAFNLGLAAVFIFLTDLVAKLATRLLPPAAHEDDPLRPRYLDRQSMETPSVALAAASRETLHMGDIIEEMLRKSMTALLTDDRKLVAEVTRMDNAVDRLHEAIKLYVTELTRESLDDSEARRATDILSFTTNLEHIGDIIDKNLMELAAKKIKNRRRFSDQGARELESLHRRVLENLRLGLGIFISGDVKIARQLLDEKVRVRDAERAAAESHLARLREGRIESIDSSSLHLDVLRDLKRIHSHICSVAYPILEAAGELRPSRLRRAPTGAVPSSASPAAGPAAE
jgi:phosphate:Na+ symporter